MASNKEKDGFENDEFEYDNQGLVVKTKGRLILVVVSVVILFFLFLLMIVIALQSSTLNHLPSVCPETTTTSDPQTDYSQSDLNAMQMLTQIYNMSKGLMTLGNEQLMYAQNNTETLHKILETTQASAQKLTEIVDTLSSGKDNDATTAGVINDILLIVDELLKLQKNETIFPPHIPISCQDIIEQQPDSPSGYYYINGELTYCEMGELCGSEGGWTRLAYLDMSDATVDCPLDWELFDSDIVRACGRSTSTGPSCSSVTHSANGVSYSQVCGRVIGYEYGTTNAVETTGLSIEKHNDINSYYVDGVSITKGHPREHVWTLMGGNFENAIDAGNCPCNLPPGSSQEVQSFIGDHYFCESGNPTGQYAFTLYPNDPLWDGEGCGSQEQECCTAPGLPWFHRSLDTSTDYLELRLCGDQSSDNENTPISFYEIYVK